VSQTAPCASQRPPFKNLGSLSPYFYKRVQIEALMTILMVVQVDGRWPSKLNPNGEHGLPGL
jgi:hypothetical protein